MPRSRTYRSYCLLVGLTEDDNASKRTFRWCWCLTEDLHRCWCLLSRSFLCWKSEIYLNCSGEGDAGTKISLSQAFYTPRFLNTSVPLGQIRLWGMISDISGTSKPPWRAGFSRLGFFADQELKFHGFQQSARMHVFKNVVISISNHDKTKWLENKAYCKS